MKVSFDRPQADSGLGNFYRWEMNFVRWLERMGYDTTYSTDVDTHANGTELLRHKAFLVVGHDEYWSKEMRDAVEFARDSGVNLAFFAANTSYTQIRYESSSAGVPNRVVVEYRNLPWAPTDPVQGPTTTGDFRWLGRPEQTMLGLQFNFTSPQIDYVVTNSSHWVYAGTTFKDGDHVAGIVGYEEDSFMTSYPPPNSANQTLLSASPFTDPSGNCPSGTCTANSSIYQAPSGAWVFDAGTIAWSWGLDDVPGILSQGKVDGRIQQTTANVLNAFLYGVPTITGFTPASGPVAASVTISGTNFTGATAVKFNGVSAASFSVTSSTAIQATVPAGATTGPLSVTTPGGTATSATNFAVTVVLTVSKSSGPLGVGNGTVTSNPGGIDCGPTCSASYNMDTVVTLTAAPDLLSIFNGWTGCDTASGTTCSVTMSRARTVVASFLP